MKPGYFIMPPVEVHPSPIVNRSSGGNSLSKSLSRPDNRCVSSLGTSPIRRPWSAEEIEQVRALRQSMKLQEIAMALGRSIASVKGVSTRIGGRPRGGERNPYWTADRVDWLKRHFSVAALTGIRAQFPEKSAREISSKASSLGLRRQRPESQCNSVRRWTTEEDEVLRAACAGYRTASDLATELKRTTLGVRQRIRVLGLNRPVDISTIAKFDKRHQHLPTDLREVMSLAYRLDRKLNEQIKDHC